MIEKNDIHTAQKQRKTSFSHINYKINIKRNYSLRMVFKKTYSVLGENKDEETGITKQSIT